MKQALLRCGCLVTFRQVERLRGVVTVDVEACDRHRRLWASGDAQLSELRWPPSERLLNELMHRPKVSA